MTNFSELAELRKLMRCMEASMGLQRLSQAERDIYCAAGELAEGQVPVTTEALMKHVLVDGVSRPTFFRALKSLVRLGMLVHSAERTRGYYTVVKPEE